MTSTEDIVVVAGEPVAPVAAVPSGPLTVTVPPTAKGGDKIAVQMPDGQMMHVVVPASLTAGQPFQVQPGRERSARAQRARPIAVARTSTAQATTNAAVAANYRAGFNAAVAAGNPSGAVAAGLESVNVNVEVMEIARGYDEVPVLPLCSGGIYCNDLDPRVCVCAEQETVCERPWPLYRPVPNLATTGGRVIFIMMIVGPVFLFLLVVISRSFI